MSEAAAASGRIAPKLTEAGLWVCVVLAVVYRFAALGHLPGINGDEAYLGTKVVLFLRGGGISLRTGSQLPLEPLSFTLSALLHLLAPISFVTLRLPAAVFGTLTVLASFALFRRVWGTGSGLMITALIACLPVHIAYSRFFWEPSQTPFLSVLMLYGLARRSISWTLTAFLAALLAHPTNLFLLPVIAVPLLAAAPSWIGEAAARARHGQRLRLAMLGLGLFALAALLAVASRFLRPGPAFPQMIDRAWDPQAFALFWKLHAGLFDGSTIYSYIVGTVPQPGVTHPLLPFTLIFWLPVAVALVLGGDRFLRQLAAGLAGSLALFYLLVGPDGLAPALERYGLWMTVPHCVLLGLSVQRIAGHALRPTLGSLAVGLLAAVLLAQFGSAYFTRLQSENSDSEKTFMTGATEPKQQALDLISKVRDPSRRVRILAEDWWTYWPLRYLSLEHPDYELSIPGQTWDRRFPRDFVLSPAGPETQIFRVGFAGSGLGARLWKEDPGWGVSVIRGYGAKPILNVFTAPAVAQ